MPEFIIQDALGMTTVVFSEGDKNQYLAKGYRLVNTEQKQTEPTSSNELSINKTTIKDLVQIPNVTRAIAKQINDNKPYKSVEDLIAIAPSVNWVSYQLSFDV